ncbi:diaminopimelate epimerase [Falsibacillus pallidus]|uniref:diaminopimelate epimerase n=1 Tax=Falsibacillus pallidus TaxID=493781 RepID=UPI003D98CB8F
MNIQLYKCHGSENDFLLIDEITHEYQFSEEDRQNLAIALCDRKTSLGADGILFVMRSQHADARMRVFNSDGSEASMCGNGLRCVARYTSELMKKEVLLIETMKADLTVEASQPLFEEIPTFSVEISPVLFDLKALPMNLNKEKLLNEMVPQLSDELLFSAVAVPNPHLISFVDTAAIRSNEQKVISEYVNGPNDLFPDGVNVSFVHSLDPQKIYVRTFERGVGFTNACGTAMSASSLISTMLKINTAEEAIDVYNNGGKVQCKVVKNEENGDYSIRLIGNATYLFRASVELDVKMPENFTVLEKKEFDEQDQYERLSEEVKKYLEEKIFFN